MQHTRNDIPSSLLPHFTHHRPLTYTALCTLVIRPKHRHLRIRIQTRRGRKCQKLEPSYDYDYSEVGRHGCIHYSSFLSPSSWMRDLNFIRVFMAFLPRVASLSLEVIRYTYMDYGAICCNGSLRRLSFCIVVCLFLRPFPRFTFLHFPFFFLLPLHLLFFSSGSLPCNRLIKRIQGRELSSGMIERYKQGVSGKPL